MHRELSLIVVVLPQFDLAERVFLRPLFAPLGIFGFGGVFGADRGAAEAEMHSQPEEILGLAPVNQPPFCQVIQLLRNLVFVRVQLFSQRPGSNRGGALEQKFRFFECHQGLEHFAEALRLREGPHFWDFLVSIVWESHIHPPLFTP